MGWFHGHSRGSIADTPPAPRPASGPGHEGLAQQPLLSGGASHNSPLQGPSGPEDIGDGGSIAWERRKFREEQGKQLPWVKIGILAALSV